MPRLVIGCVDRTSEGVLLVSECVLLVSEGVLLVCLHMRRRRASDAPPGDRACY